MLLINNGWLDIFVRYICLARYILVHHSDRGLQYCSAVYQSALQKNGIRASMTDGYDCY